MKDPKLTELLYQALETERGGIQVYRHAIACAKNPDLIREWTKYLQQTQRHERVLLALFDKLGLDPEAPIACRDVVIHIGNSLVHTMLLAQETDPEGAERVAAECVVSAETKDHLNWELLSMAAETLSGEAQEALMAACEAVEDEEAEHLAHSTGWCRELRMEALGMGAAQAPAAQAPAADDARARTASKPAPVRRHRSSEHTRRSRAAHAH